MFLTSYPDPSSVVDITTFLTFVRDLFVSMWDSIKFLFEFFIHIFDPTYYISIFSYLPEPFSSILVSLVGLVLTIVFINLISKLWSIIKVW